METQYTREEKHYTPRMVEPEDIKVGYFGRFYLEDLEKDALALYGLYLLASELAPRAEEADHEGTLLFTRIVRNMAAEQQIDRSLRLRDPGAWRGAMCGICNRAKTLVEKKIRGVQAEQAFEPAFC